MYKGNDVCANAGAAMACVSVCKRLKTCQQARFHGLSQHLPAVQNCNQQSPVLQCLMSQHLRASLSAALCMLNMPQLLQMPHEAAEGRVY